MAEKDEKWPENVKGKFYVDEQCIDCDLCRETAPDYFTRNEDGGYSFVHKQPDTPEGEELCMEALEGCPVEAIGGRRRGLSQSPIGVFRRTGTDFQPASPEMRAFFDPVLSGARPQPTP